MEGTEKPYTEKYKEIMNNWNYNANYMLTSLPVLNLENSQCLIFVAQCVHTCISNTQISAHCFKCYWQMELIMAIKI